VLISQPNGFAMTARQLFGFSVVSATIDRTNGMDHMLCRQASAGSDDGFPWGQASNLAHDLPAFGEHGRSAGPVNGSIHSSTA